MTTRSLFGSLPKSFGSCGFIRSMNFRYAARISSREWKWRFGSFSIAAASAFHVGKPSRFASAVMSFSIDATCSTPILWISSGVRLDVVWRRTTFA
jgi:hypothetical protein